MEINHIKTREWNRKSYKKHRTQRLKEKQVYCLKNRLVIKEKRNKRYKERKEFIIKILGGKCNHCGNSDIRVLQFDHINGGGRKEIKKFRFSGYLHFLYNQLIQDKDIFLNKYQLLCANCNWIKRVENKES